MWEGSPQVLHGDQHRRQTFPLPSLGLIPGWDCGRCSSSTFTKLSTQHTDSGAVRLKDSCASNTSHGKSGTHSLKGLCSLAMMFSSVPTATSTSEFPSGRGLALPITSFRQSLFSTNSPMDIVKGASISQCAPGRELAQGNKNLHHRCQ